MDRIRVAFFAEILTEELDGAIRTMYQLIKQIDKRQFEFLFVYGKGPESIAGHRSLKVPNLKLPFISGYSIALPSIARVAVEKSLNDFAPDVVHIATPSLLGNFALGYARANALPVISIYHTHFISYIDYYFKYVPFVIGGLKQLLSQNHRWFYNHCDKIYVPSESIKTELNFMGVEDERMQIWKRGIDNTLFSPEKKDKRELQKLTDNDLPTIFFASRLVWEKNLETLFAIYDLIQEAGLQVNFLIAGDGAALKACKSRMKNAFFTGRVSHGRLSVLYASAEIFLFPSVSETCGNVVLEAMASGLPCVIADGGGSRDFIKQGVNGFKCDAYNAADYVEKIRLLLAEKVLRKQIIKEALLSSKGYSWDDLAATYFDDLHTLANSRAMQLA